MCMHAGLMVYNQIVSSPETKAEHQKQAFETGVYEVPCLFAVVRHGGIAKAAVIIRVSIITTITNYKYYYYYYY